MEPRWDDEVLAVKADSGRVRRYRRLQSWYREHQLGVEAGTIKPSAGDERARRAGNYLPIDGRTPSGLNFISAEAFAHAEQRIEQGVAEKAALDPVRLRRNMLSSMPMCFNIFGTLRARPALLRQLLNALIPSLDVAEVEDAQCEVAPLPIDSYLGDKSAFDAAIFFTDTSGDRRFLAVETKYTETFSPKVYDEIAHPLYVDACNFGWFNDGALEVLKQVKTNQLWRNTMLASALQHHGNEKFGSFARGDVLVLCLAEDKGASACVSSVREHLSDPGRLQHVTLEDLAAKAAGIDGLEAFSRRLASRYLNPDHIEGRPVDTTGPTHAGLTSAF